MLTLFVVHTYENRPVNGLVKSRCTNISIFFVFTHLYCTSKKIRFLKIFFMHLIIRKSIRAPSKY